MICRKCKQEHSPMLRCEVWARQQAARAADAAPVTVTLTPKSPDVTNPVTKRNQSVTITGPEVVTRNQDVTIRNQGTPCAECAAKDAEIAALRARLDAPIAKPSNAKRSRAEYMRSYRKQRKP